MSRRSLDTPPLILLGAGGHAKVLLALVRAAGWLVHGVCDPRLAADAVDTWAGVPVLGNDSILDTLDGSNMGLINGIGQLPGSDLRRRIFEQFCDKGFHFPPLIHPNAWVAPGTRLAEGVQVMAGAIVQPDCSIGRNTIINTRAGVDHDCEIGAHAHIAPGATLCGGVHIGDHSFIGAGATLIQGLTLGPHTFVRAGLTVCSNPPPQD